MGDLRAKVVRAMSSPYDSNARQAAMAIGVVPDFGFSMPMEEGLLGEVFSHKKNQKMSQFSWPQAGSVSYLEEQNGAPFPTPKTVVKAKPWKASVVHARSWSDKHDDLRSKVLETWKSLLLSAGSLTKVGVSLLKAQEIPDAGARVMQIVNDVFLCKSTATLQARASALLHYVRWRNSSSLDPTAFPVDEEDAYEYVCFLRSEGAPKSKVPRFREAVNFAGSLLGFDFSQVRDSSRIHGVAMSASFKPVSKCDPLTVAQVQSLEEAIFQADLEEACVIGFVLYVLHGRLRWSDAQCTEAEPEIDLNEGRGYLQASLYHHKTANRSSLLRHRLLPVSCLTPGLSDKDWASEWLRRRKLAGLRAGRGVPMMPRPLLGKAGFDCLPLGASQDALCIREMLEHLGGHAPQQKKIGTHSLKCTILSWMSKAGAPEHLRSIAGYHVGRSRSTLEYSRDTLAPVLHFCESMFAVISAGLFAPDATRAGRWNCTTKTIEAAVAALGGSTDKAPEHESGEASSDIDPPSEVFSEAPEMEAADDFEEASFYAGGLGSVVRVDSSSRLPVVFRHKSSRVVHISREHHPDGEGEMSVLVCGRVANANYERLDELPAVILSKCSSCWAGR